VSRYSRVCDGNSDSMQRRTSHTFTGNISSTTDWPATAAADVAAAARTSPSDVSQVKTRSAWSVSAGRYSGMLTFTILYSMTALW